MDTDNSSGAGSEKIACQQILAGDHSVFSVQRLLLPAAVSTGITSADLLKLYLEHVERFTLGIIRTGVSAAGLEFRLGRRGVVLISFASPLPLQEGNVEKTVLRITGGLLVQPLECDRGQLEFSVEKLPAGARLTLQLSDYCPLLLGRNRPSLLRKWLYRFTQAYIHKVVTIRFLRLVYRRLTGRKLLAETVAIAVRKGENI